MVEPSSLWPMSLRLAEIQRSSPALELEADAQVRARLAKTLDLVSLQSFTAHVRVTPWLDGAELEARWRAVVTQTCGVSLEAFDTALEGGFTVRAVPVGSPAAAPDSAEVSIDPEAEDPPDLLEGDELDVGGYLVEHLALEIDPFPRKPGAAFEPPPPEGPASPFAALLKLKPQGGGTD